MHVYCILNTVNGKRYIGLTTVSLTARWYNHVADANAGSKRLICRAIRKYGPGAFVMEALLSMAGGTTWGDLAAMERYLIAQEGTMMPAGYNMTPGGEGILQPLSDEIQIKLAAEKKKVTRSPEWRARMRQTMTGRKLSPEAVAKMSAAQTPDRRAAVSAKLKDRPKSAEAIANMRAATTPEVIAKRTRAGRTLSEDSRAKVAAGWTPERKAAHSIMLAQRNRLRAAQPTGATH